MFRKVLFWCHLVTALFVGIVVLIMSVTGVILTYEKQMLAWSDKRAAAIELPSPGTVRQSIDTIIERVRVSVPDSTITSITQRRDPQAPITVALNGGVTVLAHPYTGHVIGAAPTGMRQVFRTTTEWHRYLAGTGENRAVGKAITGACNLGFLFIVLSGIYLWMPRRWTSAAVAAISVPRLRHATSKARDFNWHNALGFWAAIPLAIVVASATVISYPWASDLAYRVVGDEPPPRAAATRPNAAANGPQESRPDTRAERGDATASVATHATAIAAHWRTAEGRVANWKTITLRVPPDSNAPLTFTIDEGHGGQPQLRGTLTIQPATGASKWEAFADQSVGRRFRSMLRFAHTGEYWGLAGQTVAGVASAAACVLVWTGFALAWRRFAAWRSRRTTRYPLKKAA